MPGRGSDGDSLLSALTPVFPFLCRALPPPLFGTRSAPPGKKISPSWELSVVLFVYIGKKLRKEGLLMKKVIARMDALPAKMVLSLLLAAAMVLASASWLV